MSLDLHWKGGVEAPIGLEPMNKGFADLPLSHLGTAPDLERVIVFYAAESSKFSLFQTVSLPLISDF